MSDFSKAERIIKALQLDPTANLKRMSKGMKQKTALVAAFMADLPILILDEPTTGLDSLVRSVFIEMILEEKKKGHTIFFSSHMFEELEETADSVGLIKDGHILEVVDINALKKSHDRYYAVKFSHTEDYKTFAFPQSVVSYHNDKELIKVYKMDQENISEFLKTIDKIPLDSMSQRDYTLQSRFEEIIINKEAKK